MTDLSTLPDLIPAPEDIKDAAPEVLEAERRRIVASADGNFRNLSEEQLMRLAYITGTLRRRASGPPKATRIPKTPKLKPTLDSLLEELL